VADFAGQYSAAADELTIRGTALGATANGSRASTPRFPVLSQALELAALARPQGCSPDQATRPHGRPVATPHTAATTSWEDHEFRNPPRPVTSDRRRRRRLVYAIRDGLRSCGSRRVGGCGRKRIARDVEVVRRRVKRGESPAYKHAYFRGLLRCGSVWECAVCGSQIRAERAIEVDSAVEGWGPECVSMLSLTVRHGLGDDLRAVRAGVADSFRRLINGKPWKRFCSKVGLKHIIRALEVTHGPEHGWHPHLHALLFFQDELTEGRTIEAIEWLRARWARCVRRALGDDFAPNSHGVDLRASKRSDYLVKSTWDLLDPGSKRGRRGNRTPLQIAHAAALTKRPEDVALWVAYCDAMRGAKMLTWSRGLREAVGLDASKTDQELLESEDEQEAEDVATVDGRAWDRVRDRAGMACAILEIAELTSGRPEAFQAIEDLIRSRGSPVPAPEVGLT
jgi:hypothetical protein